jgi:1D-myo-inositol 3-kinase
VSDIHHSTIHHSSLIIGHICHDVIPNGYTPGGAAAYAGLLSHRLGHPTNILTSFGPDFQFASQFEGINVHVKPSPATTIFENIYHDGQRTQYLHSRAELLTPADVPKHLPTPKTVLLGPICDEVSFGFLDFFAAQSGTITCACPQGWMRKWDDRHRVSPKPIPDWLVLAKADIISMSEADVAGDWNLIHHIATIANILLVTQGAHGAVVFEKGQRRHFPSLPVEELDPTGAGDIFAAAFLLNYAEGKDLEKAVQFAHLMAGLSVKGSGMASVPGRQEIFG